MANASLIEVRDRITEVRHHLEKNAPMMQVLAALNLTHPEIDPMDLIKDFEDVQDVANAYRTALDRSLYRARTLDRAVCYMSYADPTGGLHVTLRLTPAPAGSVNPDGLPEIELTFIGRRACAALYREGQWSFHS
jgi:hypothetical protein